MNCGDCGGQIRKAKHATFCLIHKKPYCRGCWPRHRAKHRLSGDFDWKFDPNYQRRLEQSQSRGGGC